MLSLCRNGAHDATTSLRQIMQEWCTAAFERLERDGFIIRRVILPTSKEDTDPFEC